MLRFGVGGGSVVELVYSIFGSLYCIFSLNDNAFVARIVLIAVCGKVFLITRDCFRGGKYDFAYRKRFAYCLEADKMSTLFEIEGKRFAEITGGVVNILADPIGYELLVGL